MVTKRSMILDGIIKNIRSTVSINVRGNYGTLFYVEPPFQHEVKEILKLEGYKVINVAKYELKVSWIPKEIKINHGESNEPI